LDLLTPTALACEHLAAPDGLNTRTPRFTWALDGAGRNRRQSAYRILVGSGHDAVAAGRGDAWDSGRIPSAETLLVPYAGRTLRSGEVLFWSVQVWDEAGRESPPAPPAMLRTGLLDPSDWTAAWICRFDVPPGGREPPTNTLYDNPYRARPADYFRGEFGVRGRLRRATAYATAHGVYDLHVNGARLGDARLAPGWTDYARRTEYQTYDLTALLRQGPNAIGAVVGEGWFCGRVGYVLKRQGAHYGWRQEFLCQVVLEYEDGTREVVGTDANWRVGLGEIVYSDLLLGEKVDARLAQPGWARPGHDVADWHPVEVMPRHAGALDAPRSQPIRAVLERPARFLHTAADGEMIFDVGQNLAGVARLELAAPEGTVFVLRHAEMLTPEGELYTVNLRGAPATDTYIAAGTGRETFEPRFTFHGFRYVGITAPGIDPAGLTLTALAIMSDTPLVGSFECGSVMVNQLVSNILWSQRGNFLSVPTDCPQRDERLGWTADAQVFLPTAAYNMDVAAFFTKWLLDLEDSQMEDGAFPDVAPSAPHIQSAAHPPKGAPAWADGAVIMAWQIYLRYGDIDLLQRTYQPLVRWLDYVARHNPDHIRTAGVNRNYGDWLSVGPNTDKALVATAYWAHMAELMSRIARVLHRRQDAARYAALFETIRERFWARFGAPEGRLTADTQTAYLLALDFRLAEGERRRQAASHLRRKIAEADNHLALGFLGVRPLCPVLSDIGAGAEAYRLLLNETYPSWGFSVRQGATTIWERWDGWTPERGFQSPNMNSFNHYAYGAVGEWLFSRVAGIDLVEDQPGFRRILLHPLPSRALGWCRAEYRGHLGPIRSAWRYAGDTLTLEVGIPANCDAIVVLPVAAAADATLDGRTLDDSPDVLERIAAEGGVAVLLGSGSYRFILAADRAGVAEVLSHAG
jgi:alpha-L-rhamnosidase